MSYELIFQHRNYGIETRYMYNYKTDANAIAAAGKLATEFGSPWFRLNGDYYEKEGNTWFIVLSQEKIRKIRAYMRSHGFDEKWEKTVNNYKSGNGKKHIFYHANPSPIIKGDLRYGKGKFSGTYADALNYAKWLSGVLKGKWIILDGRFYFFKNGRWGVADATEKEWILGYIAKCNREYRKRWNSDHWDTYKVKTKKSDPDYGVKGDWHPFGL